MEIKDVLKIASEFADNPGARDREDGPNSGQQFLEDILHKRFEKAVANKYILLIDLDDLWGCPSSFISGSFGALSLEMGSELLLKHLEFQANGKQTRIDNIKEEIRNPTKKKNKENL